MSTSDAGAGLAEATGSASVVIVNAQACEQWIPRLIYTLQRAGMSVSEDYPLNGGTDRAMVFRSPNAIALP